MASARGDHSQTVASASSVAAPVTSSSVGCSCQKSRMPKARPPDGVPTYPSPAARVPPSTRIHEWPGPVRLRISNPCAVSWDRL